MQPTKLALPRGKLVIESLSPMPEVDGVEHHWVEVNGLEIHYAEAGAGEPLPMQ